jgi:acetate kinase
LSRNSPPQNLQRDDGGGSRTINGGSSSIRFAVYEAGKAPRRRLDGKIDRIGLSGTNLIVNDPAGKPQVPRRLAAADHRTAVDFLLDWLEAQPSSRRSKPWDTAWCTA